MDPMTAAFAPLCEPFWYKGFYWGVFVGVMGLLMLRWMKAYLASD